MNELWGKEPDEYLTCPECGLRVVFMGTSRAGVKWWACVDRKGCGYQMEHSPGMEDA